MLEAAGCPDCQQLTSGACPRHLTKIIIPETTLTPVSPDGTIFPLEPTPEPPVIGATYGWKCPGCSACYAPFIRMCDFCGPKTATGTSTLTIF